MVVDQNAKASAHLNSLMNLYWTPTCYMDGGNQVTVGSSQTTIGNGITSAGHYAVNDIELTLSVAWIGSTQVEVTVVIKNNQFFNTAPNTPAMPAGPTIGVAGSPIPLTAVSTDPDAQDLWYMFDFTNGDFSEWIGPYASGEEATYNKAWPAVDDSAPYRVRVKDTYDAVTGWSPYNYIEIVRRGDANGDTSLNIGDAVFLITYIFKSGPEPDPYDQGDANCDFSVNIGDAVYIINYIFGGGPPPSCD